MEYSKTGLALTERFEGCRLVAYQDVTGVWTIGYGHTFQVKPGMTCTQAEADAWLETDIQFAAHCVNRAVKVPLTQGEFDGLVDFVFNVGCGNFEGSMLLMMLNAGEYSQAAAQFARWDKAGGKELAQLLARRQAEEAEFMAIDPEIAQG